MSILQRRRALMSAPNDEKNAIIPGNYTNGSSTYSVDADHLIHLNGTFNARESNGIKLPFKEALSIQNGDTVRIKIIKVSGSLNGANVTSAKIGSNTVIQNKSVSTGATFIDNTHTATATYSGDYFVFWRSNDPSYTFTNYVARLEIYINGKQEI